MKNKKVAHIQFVSPWTHTSLWVALLARSPPDESRQKEGAAVLLRTVKGKLISFPVAAEEDYEVPPHGGPKNVTLMVETPHPPTTSTSLSYYIHLDYLQMSLRPQPISKKRGGLSKRYYVRWEQRCFMETCSPKEGNSRIGIMLYLLYFLFIYLLL